MKTSASFRLIIGFVGIIAAASVGSGPAQAYKIAPSDRIHESITMLAEQCVIEAAPREPSDCRRFAGEIASLIAPRRRATFSDLQLTVRWPDDPARQLVTTGLLSFGGNMLGNCKRRMLRNPNETLDTVGILCTSHFGRFQFFHAMASARGERTEDTRAKILNWADLTFRLGTNRTRANSLICDYFKTGHQEIASAFQLTHSRHCARDEDPWTLATIFNWRCGGITMGRCEQMLRPATSETLAARVARGALLHMIQDSYSESHADRGAPRPFRSRVSCRLPVAFHNFLGQRGHGAADHVPVFDKSCSSDPRPDNPRADDTRADDVITASAMTIYHLQNRTDPPLYSEYLQKHVFGRLVPAAQR